jgi:protocatechuate 3,4-dioxygenase beta subunit
VLDTSGKPVANATIETWETDENGKDRLNAPSYGAAVTRHTGFYDTQYAERDHPDCRGRLRTDADGRYHYRTYSTTCFVVTLQHRAHRRYRAGCVPHPG